MKKLLAFLAVAFLSANAFALDIPRPIGYVSDFAGVMDANARQQLDQKLREYERLTSIEVVVVTVPSLQGTSVEDFAQELFSSWKIGKRGKNNGVLILNAPTERRIRIHTGYGIEPYLTDMQCGRIIRDVMTPLMKQGDLSGGLVAGASAVLRELGDTPYEVRMAERKAEEEARRIESEKAAKAFGMFMLALLVVGALIGLGSLIYAPIRRRNEAKEEGPKLRNSLPGRIKKAKKLVSHEDVRSEPKKLVERAQKLYAKTEARIKPPINWLEIYPLLGEVESLLGEAEEQATDEIECAAEERAEKEEEIRNEERMKKRAKRQAPKLLRKLPAMIQKAEARYSRKGYGEARQLVKRAKDKYRKARSLSQRKSNPDWLTVFVLLLAAQACLRRAREGASSGDYSAYDDDFSLVPTAVAIGLLLSGDSDSGGSDSGYSSSDSGGGYSGGGGFSGGGGSSGGGGASGSY